MTRDVPMAWAETCSVLPAGVVWLYSLTEYAMIDSTIVRAHQHSARAQEKMRIRRSATAAVD
jgi:hypothetical protein